MIFIYLLFASVKDIALLLFCKCCVHEDLLTVGNLLNSGRLLGEQNSFDPVIHHMKSTFFSLAFLAITSFSYGQCSSTSIQVSSSDTTQVQLYHAGFFLIDSGQHNVCVWEVTTFQGTVIHQDTTLGMWADQSFSLFDHSVPITDSMQVTLVITNPVAGITCSMTDTLFWEETEVLPGSFIGDWAILGDYVGTENQIITSINDVSDRPDLEILPSLVTDQFIIRNTNENNFISVFDSNGQLVFSKRILYAIEPVDVSSQKTGIYYVRVYDSEGTHLDVKKFVKL